MRKQLQRWQVHWARFWRQASSFPKGQGKLPVSGAPFRFSKDSFPRQQKALQNPNQPESQSRRRKERFPTAFLFRAAAFLK